MIQNISKHLQWGFKPQIYFEIGDWDITIEPDEIEIHSGHDYPGATLFLSGDNLAQFLNFIKEVKKS